MQSQTDTGYSLSLSKEASKKPSRTDKLNQIPIPISLYICHIHTHIPCENTPLTHP